MSNNNENQLIQYKSPTAITKYTVDKIKAKVLGETEQLTEDPSTFASIIASNLGELGAVSFFESLIYKKECNVSTAIRYPTLFRKLLADDLALVFGQPSKTTFSIAYQVDEILQYAVPDAEISTIKRLRINKDCIFTIFGQQTFCLDHSVDIEIVDPESENPTFKATFDTSDKYTSSLSDVNNNLLNVRKVTYNKKNYICFDIPARQYIRSYYETIVNSSDVADIKLPYKDNLMGFEVLYKTSTSNDWKVLTGSPEGVDPGAAGYNYELSRAAGINSIIIKFGRNTGDFKPALRSNIKVVLYTTTGASGNISFPGLVTNPSGLTFSYLQDKENDYEMALVKLRCIVEVRQTSATGGRNQMGFEEIRDYIIARKNSSEIITDSSLKRKASEYGFSTRNTRHDLLGINYLLSSYLKDSNNDYISSGSGKFLFYFDDLILRSEIKARLIKPSHVFTLDKRSGIYRYNKKPDTYKEYVKKYKNNSSKQVSFPYFIKVEATDVFRLSVYDLAINDEYFTEVEDSLTAILDNISINNVRIYRNPAAEKVEEDGGTIDGVYIIRFQASTSANTIAQIKAEADNPLIKFRLSFHSIDGEREYWCDALIERNENGEPMIDTENNSITVSATLTTSNNIDNNDLIAITGYSLRSFPPDSISSSQYFINMNMNMKIHIIFRSEAFSQYRNTAYDKYLTKKEIDDFYYVGTIYSIKGINLGRNLTQVFGFIGDINILDSKYDVYTDVVYKTYENDVFVLDESGSIVMEEKIFVGADGNETTVSVPKIKHRKGDFVLDLEGNKIILHDIGDAKLDEAGNIVPIVDNKYYCTIEDVPFFDRIYNVNNKYFDIINAFDTMIINIEAMRSVVLKGIKLNLGIKASAGESSNYYYYDLKDKKHKKLDNLAISLKLGVRFPEEMTQADKDLNKVNIISATQKYMREKVTDSFDLNLFDYLKQQIPSAKNFAILGINNFDSLTTQNIVKKLDATSVDDEILCFKFNVDEENSSFVENKENIIFKPAIEIEEIP